MLTLGPKVEVYRNLHEDCFSVRSNSTQRVIGHERVLVLKDVQFVVRPAGREKVRRTGCKNVHAFAKGHLVYSQLGHGKTAEEHTMIYRGWRKATYNPYKNNTFVDAETGEPVLKASKVRMDYSRPGAPVIWYSQKRWPTYLDD